MLREDRRNHSHHAVYDVLPYGNMKRNRAQVNFAFSSVRKILQFGCLYSRETTNLVVYSLFSPQKNLALYNPVANSFMVKHVYFVGRIAYQKHIEKHSIDIFGLR